MKRTIRVSTSAITITATIDSKKIAQPLVRSEVEEIRDALADRLQSSVAHLPFVHTPINRVAVR